MVTEPCHYCGAVLGNIQKSASGNGDFEYTGIDRVDNALGYTASNCVPCCRVCNLAKNDRSRADFIAWIGRVAQHTNQG